VAVGSFEGAVDPGAGSFMDFPGWVETCLKPMVEERRPAHLTLFCTGGIRCEKATSYLVDQGFGGAHHLEGGILRYLEESPEQRSRWRGDCFVFDQRVAVNHRLGGPAVTASATPAAYRRAKETGVWRVASQG